MGCGCAYTPAGCARPKDEGHREISPVMCCGIGVRCYLLYKGILPGLIEFTSMRRMNELREILFAFLTPLAVSSRLRHQGATKTGNGSPLMRRQRGWDEGPNQRKRRVGGWVQAPFTPLTGGGPPQFQTPGWVTAPDPSTKKERGRTSIEPGSRGSLLTPRSPAGTLYVGNMPSGMATAPMLTGLFTKAVSSCEGFDPALGPPILSVQMCGGGTCAPLPEPKLLGTRHA